MNNRPQGSRASLSRREQIAFARRAVVAQLREIPGGLRVATGLGTRDSTLVLRGAPPDSANTRRVRELADEAYGPELLQHCLRCWYMADLFAQREHHAYDPELLYIACLMHDIALTDDYRPTPDDAPCFAVHGADVTKRTLQAWGADTNLCETVHTAIATHLDVTAPPQHGVEAYLLHAAARLDVVGARAGDLPSRALREINTRHPRTRFATTLSHRLGEEARRRPHSRIAVLWKCGMRIPVALNPVSLLA